MEHEILAQVSKLSQSELNPKNDTISIKDLSKFTANIDKLIDENLYKDSKIGKIFSYCILSAAIQLGIYPASFHLLYKAISKSEINQKFSIPVIDITNFSFDELRHYFRAVKGCQTNLEVFHFDLEKITSDNFHFYVSKVLAAGIAEKCKGPLFLHSGRIYFEKNNFENDRENMMEQLKSQVESSIKTGIYNLEIDANELFDCEKSELSDQFLMNLKMVAMVTNLWIRKFEPKGNTVSVNGVISKVNDHSTSEKELREYLKRLFKEGSRLRFNTPGEDVCSVRVFIQNKNIDVQLLHSLNDIAKREFGLGGIIVDIGKLDKIDDISSIAALEAQAIYLSLSKEMRNEDSIFEILNLFRLSNTTNIPEKYFSGMKQVPDFKEFQ